MTTRTDSRTLSLEASAQSAKQFMLSLAGGFLGLVLSWTVAGLTMNPMWWGWTLFIAAPMLATVGARLGGPFEKSSLPMWLHTVGGIAGFFVGCFGFWYYFAYVTNSVRNPNPLPPAVFLVLSPLVHAKIGRFLGIRLARLKRGLTDDWHGEPADPDLQGPLDLEWQDVH